MNVTVSLFLLAFFFINRGDLMHNIFHFREQYGIWKAECQKMVPAIGSGKIITAPIISDGGPTIIESLATSNLQDENGVGSTYAPDSSLDHLGHMNNSVSDKKVIQWTLTLHQIGRFILRVDSLTT